MLVTTQHALFPPLFLFPVAFQRGESVCSSGRWVLYIFLFEIFSWKGIKKNPHRPFVNTRGRCAPSANCDLTAHAPFSLWPEMFERRRVWLTALSALFIADLAFSVWVNLWTTCGPQTTGPTRVPITRPAALTAAITATTPVTATWRPTADQVSGSWGHVVHTCGAIPVGIITCHVSAFPLMPSDNENNRWKLNNYKLKDHNSI